MSAAAEHALRTLAGKLLDAADGMPENMDVGREVMLAMGVAHQQTADQLQAEREGRERALHANPSGFRYDPRGKAPGGR